MSIPSSPLPSDSSSSDEQQASSSSSPPLENDTVAGNEGVAVVESIGPNVTNLRPGQWVVPQRPVGLGTWRTHAVVDSSAVRPISQDIPVEYAATLSVNPCTAYRLLVDFSQLQAGDVLIQNASNSAVGQAVIQIAASKGIKTINIIRNRPDFAETVEYLKSLGGDIVITDEYLKSAAFKTLTEDLPKPKLALNAVGGKSATDMARHLAKGATCVTYGGMSREPVTLPTGMLIFNDVQFKGFSLPKWVEENGLDEYSRTLDAVFRMVLNGELKWQVKRERFSSLPDFLRKGQLGEYTVGKRVFMFQ